jgi:hypothetical protein
MTQTVENRSRMAQRALDLRARAERFRTFAETSRRMESRQTLLDIAHEADQFAQQIEGSLEFKI